MWEEGEEEEEEAEEERMAAARLEKERKDWRKDHPPNFSARPTTKADGSADLMVWECTIPGPENTEWAGGVYKLKLQFPPSYPMDPPVCRFTPPIFHVNVFDSGHICLSILSAEKDWRPSITLKDILVGIQAFLTAPNIASPANGRAAQVFSTDKNRYLALIREQAKRFAPEPDEVTAL